MVLSSSVTTDRVTGTRCAGPSDVDELPRDSQLAASGNNKHRLSAPNGLVAAQLPAYTSMDFRAHEVAAAEAARLQPQQVSLCRMRVINPSTPNAYMGSSLQYPTAPCKQRAIYARALEQLDVRTPF
jgi:hypothetical protein